MEWKAWMKELPPEVLRSKAMKAVFEFHWKHTGKRQFRVNFCASAVHLAVTLLYFGMWKVEYVWRRAHLGIFLLFAGFLAMLNEAAQWHSLGWSYWEMRENLIQVTLNLCTILFIVNDTHAVGPAPDNVFFNTTAQYQEYLAFLIVILLGINIMFYIRGTSKYGYLVRMVFEMMLSVSAFLVILMLVAVTFTFAFWMLDSDARFAGEDMRILLAEDRLRGDVPSATVVKWLFATFQHVYRIGFIGDVEYDDISPNPMLVLCFFMCSGIMTIVMLNALIAIMSNKYEEIQGSVEVEMLRSRWNMMGESVFALQLYDNASRCFTWLSCCKCRRKVHPQGFLPKNWQKFHPRPKYLVLSIPVEEGIP
jgi:hypothetical protein